MGCAGYRRTTAGNSIGKLSEFDPTSDSVSANVERANLLFEANEIAAAKRGWPCFWALLEGEHICCYETSCHPPYQRIKRSARLWTYWRNITSRRLWWFLSTSSLTVIIKQWASWWRSTLQDSGGWQDIVSLVRIWMTHSEIILCVGYGAKRFRKSSGDGLDGSATHRDCTYNAENPRKLQSPSCAAELIPQSRNIGKVSSIMDRARP